MTIARFFRTGLLAAAALLLAAPLPPALAADSQPSPASEKLPPGIAWFKGDVDAAFAAAKASNKPLFLYWGASWCPYCSQVKATIFNRQAFIERSRHFIPVYLDGDLASAQKLGARFRVRGYPSMILFKPDGSEIVRLPGEVDSGRYLQVLNAGLGASRPFKDTLQSGLAAPATLKPEEWRLLAFHSWESGEDQVIAAKDLPRTLQRLAQSASPGEAATRLALNAMVASATAKASDAADVDKPAAAARLTKLLGDPGSARAYSDIFCNSAGELVKYLAAGDNPQSAALVKTYQAALQKLAADQTLSKTDRVNALAAQVAIARVDSPTGALDAGLVKALRNGVAQADKATTDQYERQSVVHAASSALRDAELLDDSDALLKAELKRSHAAYYFMSALAANAKKRGDKTGALNWYEQAYQASKGPATRVQWGAGYANNLLDLAPEDETRIEKTVDQLVGELADAPDIFYERNARSLNRLGSKLLAWNKEGKHKAAFDRLHARLDGVCAKLPANDGQKAVCQGVLDPKRPAA